MHHNNDGPCPVCGGSKGRVLYTIAAPFSAFQLVQCENCTLTRTFPFPMDDALPVQDISDYYGKGVNKFLPLLQRIRNRITRSRAKHYISLIPDDVERPRVLDVGCAEGRLLNALLDFGCECWGIEHPAYPSERFLRPEQIRYLQGDLCSLPLPEDAYHLIFLWHVLEHMDDPQLILGRLYRLLAPEGILIVAIPNFSSLEASRFERSWFHLDIPWHKYHFTERSFRYLTTKNNYRIVGRSTLCFEMGPYGLFQSVLNAMGWPNNEFYEALKGSMDHGRSIHLISQFLIMICLLIPTFFANFITSNRGKGPVLKFILKKG